MCMMSMVHDHYKDLFPSPTYPWPSPSAASVPPIDIEALRNLINDFNAAVAAAKTLDVLMKQPDCVDPEKAELQKRVASLELLVGELLLRTAK